MSQQNKQDSSLNQALADLAEAAARLDEVMGILYQTLDQHGLKPTVHLINRQERLRQQISAVQSTGKNTLDQLRRLQSLVHISALLTSSLEINEVLEDVMDTVVELTGAERAYLMLYDDHKELVVQAARNWDQKSLAQAEIGLSRSVIDMVLANGEYVITTNAQVDDRFRDQESIIAQGLRSILCLPLELGGTVVGVLYADNRIQKGVFSESLIPILKAFGGQSAIAITNAQLFGQVRQDLDKANRVIQDLQIEVDKDKVNQQVDQITQSEYFQGLLEAAREMRSRQRKARSAEEA